MSGPPEALIKIALHGVRGRIELNGQVYDREMPGFASSLSDEEIAALVSYVRRRFGPNASTVDAEMVRALREQHRGRTDYWEADELLGQP